MRALGLGIMPLLHVFDLFLVARVDLLILFLVLLVKAGAILLRLRLFLELFVPFERGRALV